MKARLAASLLVLTALVIGGRFVAAAAASTAFPSNGLSQTATTIFMGRPSVKVSEGGNEGLREAISFDRAGNLRCVISRIGDAYYWASRENT